MKFGIPALAAVMLCATDVIAEEDPIVTNWNGVAYSEMVAALGAPADKTAYTIYNAPTKSWNHRYLFEIYPKIPENYDRSIMEVTWDQIDFILIANFHVINGTNQCFLAMRMRKGTRY